MGIICWHSFCKCPFFVQQHVALGFRREALSLGPLSHVPLLTISSRSFRFRRERCHSGTPNCTCLYSTSASHIPDSVEGALLPQQQVSPIFPLAPNRNSNFHLFSCRRYPPIILALRA
ncbi:hypothetical protein AVEN_10809-1 [Araneus ventricosus]|uniref:Uncharacterized protein n=1 Tax=Araneus ventricosus TaxID=182803 RepID=A0A4Y2SG39_ARAVE|nr:hypothetical protein AVEN_10809-1 [Araneus ventricosus]